MSETVSSQRKPSTNKNIKKLRTLSAVCNLARSWQQWVSENEEKHASEPSGWTPDSVDKTKTEKKEPKKPVSSELKTKQSQDNKDGPEDTRIKTKQVVKTVTRDVQEKSAGIEFLTNRICKDPAAEELDRMLKNRSSPTRRRNCSNMVSELTQSWKKVEKERKRAGESSEGSGISEAKERALDLDISENQENAEENDTEPSLIKRPSSYWAKREAEDANKINALSSKYSAVGNLKSRWQNWASEHSISQKLNPFSDDFDHGYSMSLRLRKGEEGYGRPKEGTKTAERAKRAEQHIHREIEHMCFIISTMADPDPNGYIQVTFGELFDRYVRISDKVVGILMRARKHGKVDFEGEMLWQGRDDRVIITLLV
ncbi:actin-binding Rho-activating protein [Silurus asotus]|uniref:Actin-binding Rho-activating protein n=1 Tax=Silurus asotus TaxID=30991 RepID=A0AAD5FMQ9_SILAS|nr:actin-binding Rho-activating protein [Silurus asotus]